MRINIIFKEQFEKKKLRLVGLSSFAFVWLVFHSRAVIKRNFLPSNISEFSFQCTAILVIYFFVRHA